MIHRDLCLSKFTKDWSSLRIQFHLLLSRHVCFNGLISLTKKEMAEKLECKLQSIHKHIKRAVREGILTVVGDNIYLQKKVTDPSQGYVRHYAFLESPEFKSCPIHTQRFVLHTLSDGVYSGRTFKRDLTSLYHSTEERAGLLNLYYKEPLYEILEEAKQFLKLEIYTERGREWVRVIGIQDQYAQNGILNNVGEMKHLEDTLIDRYSDEYLSEHSRIEIIKIKKNITDKLGSVGYEIYSQALENLLSVYRLFEMDNKQEVGKYFRSIIQELEKDILPSIKKRVTQTKYALERTKDLLVDTASIWVTKFEGKIEELSQVLKIIKSKSKEDPPDPFPFYNWLDNK